MTKSQSKKRDLTIRTPLQLRSQKTLERILAAVEKLLESRSFEEITIADVVRKARSSIGAFYARFPNKEALLPVLYDRCTEELGAKLFSRLQKRPRKVNGLAETLAWGMDIMVDEFREHRFLFRAIGLYSRLHPEAISDEHLTNQVGARQPFVDFLLSHVDEIKHPDPEYAVRFGFFVTGATCREKIVFGSPHAAATQATDQQLKQELTRVFLGYLGC